VESGVRRLGGLPVADEKLTRTSRRRRLLQRGAMIGLGVAIVVATFAYVLPTIANYADVWDIVNDLTWPWVAALLAATAVNLVTFAPPWMVALPGLSFLRAMELTQASTALSIVVPGGAAVGIAGAYGMTRRWRFPSNDIARALTVTGLWNQFLNLLFPIVGVFLLTISGEGERTAALATVAFVGVAILGIVLSGFVLVLLSNRLAGDIGDVAARFVSWARSKIRRGPVTWSGRSFERFRADVGDFLERKWPYMTLASLAGSLTVFAILLVSLRALGVNSSQVSGVEAFAAWALVRLIGQIPITPGGIGIVELGLTTTLVGFGGPNAPVVAAVLVYRFLTVVPTLVLGLCAAFTFRRKQPPDVAEIVGTAS
jgi:putative heme transporter